jgi:thiamine-phosphate pyrophosphorylase
MTLPATRLYAICDADLCTRAGWRLVDLADACLDGGARLIQVRAKTLSGRDFLDAAVSIVELGRACGALVVINDRADIARLANAGGVHVGQDDLTPRQVRAVAAAGAVVGLSTHTAVQIEAAVRAPIDYLAIGPLYATSTKATGYDAVGPLGLRRACSVASAGDLPVIAIGGITLARAPELIEGGAAAVAVAGDLLATGDPRGRVRAYLAELGAPPEAPTRLI